MKKKYLSVLFLALIILARILTSEQSIRVMSNLFDDEQEKSVTIVIDPGHGGRDPGKVGVNKANEKDINLQISLKLRDLLEQDGIDVVMTREEDIGLYSDGDPNKKRSDLDKRVGIINSSGAAFALCIHQNSFTQEYCRGAQVFYHTASEEGKILANTLQEQLKETIQDGNHRVAKSNETYYMLKHTDCPLVIVECGYLSNHREAELLTNEAYQDKLALGIYRGVKKYINGDGITG